jgi:hypothetical protein
MKKNMRTDTENTPDVVAKKSKIDIPNRKIKDQSTKPLTSSFLFAPPQLQRPNVSTEDVGYVPATKEYHAKTDVLL